MTRPSEPIPVLTPAPKSWPDASSRCRGLRIELALRARDAGLHRAARGMILEVLDELDEHLDQAGAHELDRAERHRARCLLGELGSCLRVAIALGRE